MRRLLVGMSSLVIIAALVVGCGSSGGDKAASDTTTSSRYGSNATTTAAASGGPASGTVIDAKDFAFTPTALTLKAGPNTLTVTNNGAIPHNLTIKDLGVNADLAPGKTVTVKLTAKPGTHEFHCEYHPSAMKGTVTVK